MLVFREKLFDGFLRGSGNVYTQTADADLLSAADRVTVGLVLSAVTGTDPSITVQFENSPDGTRWMNQSASPEVDGTTIPGSEFVVWGTNEGSRTIPIAGYVRLRIALGGTSPAAYLRLWVIGRSPAF